MRLRRRPSRQAIDVSLVAGLAVLLFLPFSPLSLVRSSGGEGLGYAVPRASPLALAATPPSVQHVVVVMLENQPVSAIMNQPANSAFSRHQRYFADSYAFSSRFYGVKQGSGSDYVAATSGSTSSAYNQSINNLGNYLDGVRPPPWWEGYMESMPTACDTTSSGSYDTGHNPWIHYQDIGSNSRLCAAHEPGQKTNFSAWDDNITQGTVPPYSFVTPNVYDDGHTLKKAIFPCASANSTLCELGQADAWIGFWLSPLVNQTFLSSTVYLILYDASSTSDKSPNTGAGGTGGHIYMAAVGPLGTIIRGGHTSSLAYNTFSILTTAEWLMHLNPGGGILKNDQWSKYWPMYDLFAGVNLDTLQISVVNSQGLPIHGARVDNTVTFRSTLVPGLATTDSTGLALVPDLADGQSFLFDVSVPGCTAKPQSRIVTMPQAAPVQFMFAC